VADVRSVHISPISVLCSQSLAFQNAKVLKSFATSDALPHALQDLKHPSFESSASLGLGESDPSFTHWN
jgi:hypothetical protein